MVLVVYRSQLLLGGRLNHSRFFSVSGRFGIQNVKNRGTNEDGEEQGDNIHTDAEKERLPAADCVEGCSFHWILD